MLYSALKLEKQKFKSVKFNSLDTQKFWKSVLKYVLSVVLGGGCDSKNYPFMSRWFTLRWSPYDWRCSFHSRHALTPDNYAFLYVNVQCSAKLRYGSGPSTKIP